VHEHRRRARGDGRAGRGSARRRRAAHRGGAGVSSRTQTAAAGAVASLGDAEYVLLGIPDVHGSIRGKALRPDAFAAALREGTVMTDLLLALDPTDTPITDYESFGIRSGAGDLVIHPEPDTLRELSWRL